MSATSMIASQRSKLYAPEAQTVLGTLRLGAVAKVARKQARNNPQLRIVSGWTPAENGNSEDDKAYAFISCKCEEGSYNIDKHGNGEIHFRVTPEMKKYCVQLKIDVSERMIISKSKVKPVSLVAKADGTPMIPYVTNSGKLKSAGISARFMVDGPYLQKKEEEDEEEDEKAPLFYSAVIDGVDRRTIKVCAYWVELVDSIAILKVRTYWIKKSTPEPLLKQNKLEHLNHFVEEIVRKQGCGCGLDPHFVTFPGGSEYQYEGIICQYSNWKKVEEERNKKALKELEQEREKKQSEKSDKEKIREEVRKKRERKEKRQTAILEQERRSASLKRKSETIHSMPKPSAEDFKKAKSSDEIGDLIAMALAG